jgi:DNA-binding FrmR family transcriptional regulator
VTLSRAPRCKPVGTLQFNLCGCPIGAKRSKGTVKSCVCSMLQGALTTCGDKLQQLASRHRALATQQAEVLAQLDTCAEHTTGSSPSSSSLVQRIAAAEADASSIQAAVAARADWAT